MFDITKSHILKEIFLLIIIVSFIWMFPSNVDAASSVSVNLDGKYIEFDQEPIIQDGRTLVPLRAIFEAMEMDVEWDQETKTVTSQKNNVIITLQIQNKNASIGTEDVGYIKAELDVPAQIINGRTMVPVRFVGEASGSTVAWNQASKTVVITSNPDREFGTYKESGILYEGKTLSYVYLGYMNNYIFEGFGSYIWSDGEMYIGNFDKDMRNGYGTNTRPDGEKYVGNWENDVQNGYGTNTWPNGDVYIGNFKNTMIDGYGTFTFATGEKYVGNFQNNMRDGYGINTWPNGAKYEGYFKNNLRHGQGTNIQSNGYKQTGLWENDKFINSST